jgi:predicted RNA-binding Zn-ribbon protein involved in translation (DUF1610 family)
MKVCRICTAVLGEEECCSICGAPSQEPVKAPTPDVGHAQPLPDLHDSDGSCLVCGIPLRGEICEMCGSAKIGVREKKLEFRCPFCEEVVDPNATHCPHCSVDYVSREKEKDLDYKCPVCGEVASLLEDECSGCGAKIWLDFESERSSVPRFLCPMCGEEVDPESQNCPKCGAGIWVGEEGAKETAEAAIGSASTDIAEEMSRAPADLARAEVVLVSAKEAFEKGDYLAANRAANLSVEIAKTTVLQTKIFQDAVGRAQSKITYLEGKGGDTSDAIELLKRAVKVKRTGNIRGAVRLAIKSRIKAEESVPGPRLSDIDVK